MAKSLRSKWRRKCRAAKREKYALKELERLKKTVGITQNEKVDANEMIQDMEPLVISIDANKIKEDKKKKTSMKVIQLDEDSDMEENIVVQKEDGSEARVYNSKTMKDQYGQYPVWMHRRKIQAKKNLKKKNVSGSKVSKKKTKRRKNKK